ncbi:RlmE family RNA methyltransferase [Buchnera aphidicola]|uniref:RlmE family RNA methyltransferase n=1 Tax=Buchnera aphidicola TaxID=9 RepID=UPI0031B89C92
MSNNKKFNNSSQWIHNHINDFYVKYSYKNKLRSRSWFKLKEIDKKNNIFKSGMKVIDLGSFPGGWSKYVISKVGFKGLVIAVDKKFMNVIKGVNFIQGDINKKDILNKILSFKKKIHVLISDMSPNISGIKFVDDIKIIKLIKISLNISKKVLLKKGIFIVKAFQGIKLDYYIKKIKLFFLKVYLYKPNSSRSSSREIYIIAISKKK